MEPQQNANCSNIYCFSCLSKQIDTMLKNLSTIKCQSCQGDVDPDVYQNIIPPYLYNKWKTTIENINQNNKTNPAISSENKPIPDYPVPNPIIPLEELIAQLLLSNFELGEPSGEVPTEEEEKEKEEEFYCSICMDRKFVIDINWVKSCNHSFCIDCLRGYISAKVEARELPIKCPDPECQEGELELEMYKDIIPPNIFEKWDTKLFEDALGDQKYYCPFPNCGLLISDERAGRVDMAMAECPHCMRNICTKCNVPWHSLLSCEDIQRLGPGERGSDDVSFEIMAAESNWKRCPECRMYVEKTAGCRKITCRCGNAFCYECGNNMPKAGHKCVTCNWEI